MRKNKVVLATALVAATMLGTAGCSSAAGGAGGAGDGPATVNKLLGIVSITANEANNAAVIASATKVAKAAGWKVEVVDAEGSAEKANSAISNFVSQKAGMIFDLVFPASSLGAGLAAAKAANIPVASWGGGPGTGIVMNTGDGGPFAQPATQLMLQNMQDKGSVLALTYQGGQVCRDRETVFDKMVAAAPGVKVDREQVAIPGYLQDGAKYATAWLGAHAKGSGNLAIWGCWDDPTLGAISSLKQEGRTDVKTYGINGDAAAIAAVQDGSLTATVYQNGAAEAQKMFAVTLQAIKAGKSWKLETINVPGIVVTKANVAEFIKQHAAVVK
jgi:ribose transport system substrate-binding protein